MKKIASVIANQIINFLLIFSVLYLGSIIASNHIFVTDLKDTLLVSMIIFVLQIPMKFLILCILPILATMIKHMHFLGSNIIMTSVTIMSIILRIVISISSIIIAETWIETFSINKLLTYFIVSVLISIFDIINGILSSKKNDIHID